MRLCAQYAMTAPERVPGLMKRLDLTEIGSLTFAKPDYESFPLLRLAYDCAKEGGVLPAVLNAADEVAVSQFLDGYIGFGDISRIVKRVVAKIPNKSAPSLSELKAASDEAVLEAAALCKSLH